MINNEIIVPLFKIWDKNNKYCLKDNQYFIDDNNQNYLKYIENIANLILIDAEICRFTGIFDKNNKPIYSGDIIEFLQNQYAKVYFSDRRSCYGFDIENLFGSLDFYYPYEHFRILGNKFENPELLEIIE